MPWGACAGVRGRHARLHLPRGDHVVSGAPPPAPSTVRHHPHAQRLLCHSTAIPQPRGSLAGRPLEALEPVCAAGGTPRGSPRHSSVVTNHAPARLTELARSSQGEAITHVISIAMFFIGLSLTTRELKSVVSPTPGKRLETLRRREVIYDSTLRTCGRDWLHFTAILAILILPPDSGRH